jgi:hypothetical protein
MLFSRFAQSAAALAPLSIGFAAPAHAQNNKQIISGTWYEDRASLDTNGTNILLTFTQTPANQFINVTNVSCAIAISSTLTLVALTLAAGSSSGATDLGRPYSVMGSPTPVTTSTSKNYSIVTNQVYYKFGPGRFPSIEIDTVATPGTPTIEINCVIVGNLTDN